MKQSSITKIAVLGGGIGGVVAANLLAKKGGKNVKVMLFDKEPYHTFSPALLHLILGEKEVGQIQRPLSHLSRRGISFINGEVTAVDLKKHIVATSVERFPYDYLIISLGARLSPESIPGLSESGYTFYTLDGSKKLAYALSRFKKGALAIVVASLPFKCPAAPYEAAFLLDTYFQKKNVRKKVTIDIFTPESFPLPVTGEAIGRRVVAQLRERTIMFYPQEKLTSVDIRRKMLRFEGKNTFSFDLLIYVPPHKGPQVLLESGLSSADGWVIVDPKTLATTYENVFAIGDCVSITTPSEKPLPKAGVFAKSQAQVVSENILAIIGGKRGSRIFDGRGSCFLETGFRKAAFASGNFYSVPLPTITMRKPSFLWYALKTLYEKYWFWKWL